LQDAYRSAARRQPLASPQWFGRAIFDDPGEAVYNPGRGLVGHLEPQMQLVRTDETACSAQQEAGLKPFVERHVTALEHRADRCAKLFAAAATELQAGAGTLSGNPPDPIGRTAACAYRSVRPDDFFELGVRRLLIPKIGPRSDEHDRVSLRGRAAADALRPDRGLTNCHKRFFGESQLKRIDLFKWTTF